MKYKLVILLSLAFIALAQFNYQERIIYIDEKENVCKYGP
jgi:hypothetical protein